MQQCNMEESGGVSIVIVIGLQNANVWGIKVIGSGWWGMKIEVVEECRKEDGMVESRVTIHELT